MAQDIDTGLSSVNQLATRQNVIHEIVTFDIRSLYSVSTRLEPHYQRPTLGERFLVALADGPTSP